MKKQYIDKSVVVAKIKERINRDNEKAASFSSNSEHDYLYKVKETVYKDLLYFLNTLEVKEVDLEKEMEKWIENNQDTAGFYNNVEFAKHFFELGLMMKK